VAPLLRSAGLRGAHSARFVQSTRVDLRLAAEGPERRCVVDITYVPTCARFLYLSIIISVWSRRVVGWTMDTHLRMELVLDELGMAFAQRQPDGVVQHSDRCSQYTSYAFGKRSEGMGLMSSMGSVGDAYDNVVAGSFSRRSNARC